MKSRFVISLLCVFQIFTELTHAGTIVPGITTLDYADYGNDYYAGNTTLRTERFREEGREGNVVEISRDVFKKIGTVGDLNEVQRMLGIIPGRVFATYGNPVDDLETETRSRKTVRYMENPSQAHCQPELHSVDLGLTSTPDIIYYPTCVRVNQCGGCCPNKDIISCQPIASEKVVVKVLELSQNPNENTIADDESSSRGRRRRSRIKVQYNTINVTVEEHKECACLCKLRESYCNLDVQIYDEKGCACICKNKDEEEKCYRKTTHFWRKETCECLCRHEFACSSSEIFDHNTCSCQSTSLGISFDNVLLRNRHSWESLLRRRPAPVRV